MWGIAASKDGNLRAQNEEERSSAGQGKLMREKAREGNGEKQRRQVE